ncbi:MAG: EAL domain-containing protein [Chloroflexi bacterium]|nr:EAL domain-containing protein [Chloroflexota bacterium]
MTRGPGQRVLSVRTRLMVPILGLVLLSLVTLILTAEMSSRVLGEFLAGQRAAAVAGGLAERLGERQRADGRLASIIAAQSDVAAAVRSHDGATLDALLAPPRQRLALDRLSVYTPGGAFVSPLSDDGEPTQQARLVADALAGTPGSALAIGPTGILVAAAAPVPGDGDPVGALLLVERVDTVVQELRSHESVDLAIVHLAADGAAVLVSSTIGDTAVRQAVTASDPHTATWLPDESALSALHLRAAQYALDDRDVLIVLVPTGDIFAVSLERNVYMVLTVCALVAALLLVGVLQARDITIPLRGVISTTRDLARGNYRRRVTPSGIQELNHLGGSVNTLAERLEEQLSELAHRAYYDSLTNLPNRSLFMERLSHALTRTARHAVSVAVIFLDLDNFKVVNDSLGHQVGDELLAAVAQRLTSHVRSEDTVARFGGDEFTLMAEDVADEQETVNLAIRIQEALRSPFTLQGYQVFVTTSLGIAISSPDHDTPDELLRAADLALYRAKAGGKDCFELFDPSLRDRAMNRLQLESDLRLAIEHQQFQLLYQPIVSLSTGQVVEVEALVRWRHPRRGIVSPLEFIPVAEESGVIIPLGRWILQEAFRQASLWQHAPDRSRPLVMCVNLSPVQFGYGDLVNEVASIIHDTGVDSACLKLEITESATMRSADAAISILTRLRSLGVRLAIDDFGTGYSSLAYLRNFPLDTLKIDRSFISGLGQTPADDAIVETIVALTRTLRLSVTAEGVETPLQLERLRALGCDRGQGFYFARPLTAAAVDALLSASEALV